MWTCFALIVLALITSGSSAAVAEQSRYSKALQKACVADYKKYCGEYGLETPALRTCMDKAGHSLSKSCVRALVDAGDRGRCDRHRRQKLGRAIWEGKGRNRPNCAPRQAEDRQPSSQSRRERGRPWGGCIFAI